MRKALLIFAAIIASVTIYGERSRPAGYPSASPLLCLLLVASGACCRRNLLQSKGSPLFKDDLEDKDDPEDTAGATSIVSGTSNLRALAETLLSNPRLAGLIVDLNRTTLNVRIIDGKRVVELKKNQKLLLPSGNQLSAYAYPQSFEVVAFISSEHAPIALLQSQLGSIVS